MRLTPQNIAQVVSDGLERQAAADDQAQVVYGFDSLAECRLHPLIQKALRQHDTWDVTPENPYPSRPNLRCDVFLRDYGTFTHEHSYWLEIKTVAQFNPSGPATWYSRELAQVVPADARKLWTDPLIRHGGLLLLLFTVDREVADHDIAAWYRRSLDRQYPLGTPIAHGFKINDRIGNGYCAVAVAEVR